MHIHFVLSHASLRGKSPNKQIQIQVTHKRLNSHTWLYMIKISYMIYSFVFPSVLYSIVFF